MPGGSPPPHFARTCRGPSASNITRHRVASHVHPVGEGMMAQRDENRSTDDARAAHKTAVAMNVAWLVGLARAFHTQEGRELRLDPEIRAAQMRLIQALRLAVTDGIPLEELRTRFINPVARESRGHGEAAALLTETMRLVERHLARRGCIPARDSDSASQPGTGAPRPPGHRTASAQCGHARAGDEPAPNPRACRRSSPAVVLLLGAGISVRGRLTRSPDRPAAGATAGWSGRGPRRWSC